MAQRSETYVDEGIDALTLLTPLVERRRMIVFGAILAALIVGTMAALSPRKYKAELSLTPVVNNKSSAALGGFAALAGATLQTGYQLTPSRMVELLKSRTVLSGVGLSRVSTSATETIMDRLIGGRYVRNDREEVAKRLNRLLVVTANKETGTITVAVEYPDSALARIVASRVVDSASQKFVRTSKAQAQQLRIAQEDRVAAAKAQLERAQEKLRQFNFSNRATPAFSMASVERDRLNREIQLSEQVYAQAATDQESAYARELEATPTVVVQDPVPEVLPKVRKRVIIKTVVSGIVSFVFLCLIVLLIDLTRRRLMRSDAESDRFRKAVSTLPRVRKSATQ
ncbi:MAG: Wzz/FepE/Etk N-terminal domain-containing protein [Gemmatimonadales bacterium]